MNLKSCKSWIELYDIIGVSASVVRVGNGGKFGLLVKASGYPLVIDSDYLAACAHTDPYQYGLL